MKKYLLLLAAATFALVGCNEPNDDPNKGQEEPGKIESIRFAEETVEISVDDVRGVQLVLFPTVEATFTTSDDAVVTVDETGRIFPVAEGTAVITAQYEELFAECTVTVVGSEWDLVKWSSLQIWNYDQNPMSTDVQEVVLTTGDTVGCLPYRTLFRLLGDGLYVSGNSLAGAGYISDLWFPMYFIVSGPTQYLGAYLSESVFEIVPEEYRTYEDSIACTLGGNIIDLQAYGKYMDEVYLQGKYDTDTTGFAAAYYNYLASIEGAIVYAVDINNQQTTVDLGLIKQATIVSADINGDGAEDFEYQMKMEWFDDFHGLTIDVEKDDLVRPYVYAAIPKTYIVWDLMSALQGGESVAPRTLQMPIKREMKALKAMKALPTMERVVR